MTQPTDVQVKQLWPTTFYVRAWPAHVVEGPVLVDFLYGLKAKASANIASGVAAGAKSALGLFESHFDLFGCPHAGLARLRTFLD